MAGGKRKTMRDGGVPAGEVAEGRKSIVFLEMGNLINMALDDINGPEMEVSTVLREYPFARVFVRFDASKIPLQIKCGAPDQHVSFSGAKFLDSKEAEVDALRKVEDYLSSKFGIRFVDWNYEKSHIATRKIIEVENSILEIIGNIKSMVGNWGATLGILKQAQTTFSASTNPFHLSLSGELVNLKCEVEACLEHISDKISGAHAEHAQCSKGSNNNFPEDAITIKISEKDIIDDILLSLGCKEAKFSHTLDDKFMYKGSCKINLKRTGSTRKTGKTIIHGDAKNTANEAECSAAAKAIEFVERDLVVDIIDLNYHTLLEKQDSLKHLEAVGKKYVAIQHLVAAEWRSMITQLKGMVNSQFEVCKDLGLDVDEQVRIETSEMIEVDVGEISFMYDFCTIGLDQCSS